MTQSEIGFGHPSCHKEFLRRSSWGIRALHETVSPMLLAFRGPCDDVPLLIIGFFIIGTKPGCQVD